mmetsp:Transcript_117795/g.231125  ORF Transcript_117795/g.231125 Transcript_117795/m.231125 type:complete len:115 (+) Transcript_117795:1655-1999(+)
MALNLFDFGIIVPTANETFDRIKRVGRVGDSLSACGHSDQSLVVIGKGNDGWCSAGTLRVFNNTGIASFHDCHTRVGCSQINSNHITGIVRFESSGKRRIQERTCHCLVFPCRG